MKSIYLIMLSLILSIGSSFALDCSFDDRACQTAQTANAVINSKMTK